MSEITRLLTDEMERLREADRDREKRLTRLLEKHTRAVNDLAGQLQGEQKQLADLQTQFDSWARHLQKQLADLQTQFDSGWRP